MNLPNRITMGRLLLAVVFFILLGLYRLQDEYAGSSYWFARIPARWVLNTALVFFVITAITDAVDGWVARHYGLVTKFGRVADPFVDKIVICGGFIFLASSHNQLHDLVWPSMVVVIVGREFLVTGIRGLLESEGVDFSSTLSGKAKMVIQCFTIGWILLYRANLWPEGAPRGPAWCHVLSVVALWLTVAITVISGIEYLVRSRRRLMAEL